MLSSIVHVCACVLRAPPVSSRLHWRAAAPSVPSEVGWAALAPVLSPALRADTGLMLRAAGDHPPAALDAATALLRDPKSGGQGPQKGASSRPYMVRCSIIV